VTRLLALLFLALALSASLAACGKVGDPTLPPGQSDDYPRKYPQPY
jgi:predicted small lipoprotein YifL